jgi:hypothetical protein
MSALRQKNTLDAFLLRTGAVGSPKRRRGGGGGSGCSSRGDGLENVSPCDDGDSNDDAVVTEVLRRWETLFEGTVGALDEVVTTATAHKRNRANDVLRAAFELAVKKSSRGDGKMDEKSRRRRRRPSATTLGNDLSAMMRCERGVDACARKRLRRTVGGGLGTRVLREYGRCELPLASTARVSSMNNAVNAIEFDPTGRFVTSGTNAGAIDVQDVGTLRVTRGELYCPKLKLSTNRYVEALKWDGSRSMVMTVCDTANSVIAYKGDSVRIAGPRGVEQRTHVMHKYYAVGNETNGNDLGLHDLVLDSRDPTRIIAAGSDGRAYLWDTRMSGERQTAQFSAGARSSSITSLVTSHDGHTVIGADGTRGDVYIWDARKGSAKTIKTFGAIGNSAETYSIVAQLSIPKLLRKTALATDVKIENTGAHWIGYDPMDSRRLGYHLNNGWSGVIDLMKPCVTHAHCPPAPWLEANQSVVLAENELEPGAFSVPISDLRRRTACWLPDGGALAVGLGVKPGIRVLDFAPSTKSRHWVHDMTIADLDKEPDDRYGCGNDPTFIETSSKIFSTAVHPNHHGELVAGGESVLCLIGYGETACEEHVPNEKDAPRTGES